MHTTHSSTGPDDGGDPFALSVGLHAFSSVQAAVDHTVTSTEKMFEGAVVTVWEYEPEAKTLRRVGDPSGKPTVRKLPDPSLKQLLEARNDSEATSGAPADSIAIDSPDDGFESAIHVPVGTRRVLTVGAIDEGVFDERSRSELERVAAALEAALNRIDRQQEPDPTSDLRGAVFDASQRAIFVSDADGTLVDLNRAATELVEIEHGDDLTTLSELAPDDGEKLRDHLETVRAGASESLVTTLQWDAETAAEVELTSHPIEVDGSPCVYTIVRGRLTEVPQVELGTARDAEPTDTAALTRLHESAVSDDDFGTTVDRVLSLGCEYLGLETGVLSAVEDTDYEFENVVDATGNYESGTVVDRSEMLCDVLLRRGLRGTLGFADIDGTEFRDHPAAGSTGAYLAAPVVVDGDVRGTVHFSSPIAREEPFDTGELRFIRLLAQWLGNGLEQRNRIEELERYETILEAVDDPVYALDRKGQFTFVNDAAKREFGYGDEMLGTHVSSGMAEEDIERVREHIEALLATDARSQTAEFELETADGEQRVVENRLALIGDEDFRGTAGILRDITARKARERELESIYRAVEEAADGVAILDDDEYVYIDRTHVEMYGFDSKDQLLGSSWRELYSDEEIARLENEAFPALESDGHWRGKVTGSRPDGSTFPAEISLTIIDDGRLVCTVRDETEKRRRQRELALKNRAMDEANVSIQITDATRSDNPLVYVNDAFERMTGYTKDEALGRNPRFLQGENTDPRKVARLREAISADRPVSVELQNYRKNGTPYWARISITPVTDESGTVTNYIGIQQDVSDRKERSQWLSSFLNEGPLMFVETRQVDGEAIVETCNDRILDRLGYDRAEVEGEPLASLYTAESVTELREGGYEDALSGEFGMDERTLVGADGERIRALLRAVPQQEEVDGTSALFVDITERKKREEQRKARGDLLERIYEVTTDSDSEFEEKISGLLDAGREHLDLPYGFLTRIERADRETGTQAIVEAVGSHESLQAGESAPLSDTYCRKTINGEGPLVVTNAVEEGWETDPAYETFGLGTYIGSDLTAIDDVAWTLCFAADEPRAETFNEFEMSLVNLISRWVSYEIERRSTHEELREQRERLELTLEGTRTGIAEWEVETGAVTWNETLIDILDRDIETFEQFEAAVHPDDIGAVRAGLADTLENGGPLVKEFRMFDREGNAVWIEARAVVNNRDSDQTRILAVATDVTDQKNQERERRRNERQYRSLAENIPNGAVITFNDDLEYELAAGELLSEFELEPSEVAGTKVGSVFPEMRDELVPRFRAALDGERTNQRVELDDRIVRLQIVPVERGDEESIGAYGQLLAQDVTEEAQREQELFEERERFRLLTENVNEYAFIVVGEDGAIQTWNTGAKSLFGYDSEAAVGMSVAELHPESDRESKRHERLLQQARIAGDSADEGWRIRADGSEFYADVQYTSFETDSDEFRGYAMIVRDMTDRRQQRRRTERFVAESEDVVTIVDTDGTISYASGSAEGVLGYEPEELVGTNLFDHLHPDRRDEIMKQFFAGTDDPDASIEADCRFESGDGEWLDVESRCRNMLDDDAVGGMLLYLRDVTESRERARRFEGIFNQTFQFTGLLEPDGTILEANDAALEFGGWGHEDVVGAQFSELSWWTHSESVTDQIRDAIDRAAGGEFVRYETEMRGADGLVTVDFSMKPVTNNQGEVALLVFEGRDVSAFRQQQKHLEVVQRVMRHNMRNDLNKLRGWTKVLRDEPEDESREKHFETIEEILDKWGAMTEKIAEIREVLSRNDQLGTTNAASLVEDVASTVREEAPEATIETVVTDDEVHAVPEKLRIAVRELVENAVSVDAAVDVRVSAVADEWVDFTISDDGPGLPEMEAEVLETGEESPLNHGQGLGLWMVRMIVKQTGGEVSVDVTSEGTAVSLRVPITQRAVA
ncbi:MAG: PAS domain S-box protein [Halobellus sp.]|uniref:PAS domain S-box protein n=1 Tax=Halobellus sp. TaxID=1979212 RepID=UPI0035D5197C